LKNIRQHAGTTLKGKYLKKHFCSDQEINSQDCYLGILLILAFYPNGDIFVNLIFFMI